MKRLIERHGQVERVWQVFYTINSFTYCILVQATENELHDYLNSEMGHVGRYSALSDAEIAAAKKLRLPIYIAPKL